MVTQKSIDSKVATKSKNPYVQTFGGHHTATQDAILNKESMDKINEVKQYNNATDESVNKMLNR